jgi:hypothetical protein
MEVVIGTDGRRVVMFDDGEPVQTGWTPTWQALAADFTINLTTWKERDGVKITLGSDMLKEQ